MLFCDASSKWEFICIREKISFFFLITHTYFPCVMFTSLSLFKCILKTYFVFKPLKSLKEAQILQHTRHMNIRTFALYPLSNVLISSWLLQNMRIIVQKKYRNGIYSFLKYLIFIVQKGTYLHCAERHWYNLG